MKCLLTILAYNSGHKCLSGTNQLILTPRKYDEHPVVFKWESPKENQEEPLQAKSK